MEILSYVELTEAQRETLRAFEKVTVRTALIQPNVVATFHTFQEEEIMMTMDPNGIIERVEVRMGPGNVKG